MDTPIFLAGHSLGGARAFQYAYSRVKRGLRVDGIYAFAPPNPGDKVISSVIKQIPIVRSIKNGRDLVCDVPVDMSMFNEEYVQPIALEDILEEPAPHDPDPLFKWHHVHLYAAGTHKLTPNQSATVLIGEAIDQVARLYQTDQDWDWINPVSGSYWAMKVMPSGAKLMIPRGTVTARDWFDDLDATQIPILGARMSQGFWAGIGPIEDQLDKVLA